MGSGNTRGNGLSTRLLPKLPHYCSADLRDALFGVHLNFSRPNSLVSLCAIPSIRTIPWTLALGMPSTQPPSILRQLPLSCSYHLGMDPWSPTLTQVSWQPSPTCVINSEQFQLMRLPTHSLNPGLVKRLPYPRPLGIFVSYQSGIQLHGFN